MQYPSTHEVKGLIRNANIVGFSQPVRTLRTKPETVNSHKRLCKLFWMCWLMCRKYFLHDYNDIYENNVFENIWYSGYWII